MDYVSKATITSIRATSRASVKVREAYYTVEYTEERSLPNDTSVDIEKERAILWDAVNNECDAQCEQILKTFSK